ncbi:MAG: cobalamin-dependent protein, partial [Candidatus Omnitrophica bacterium]|nr:cobalamin-dependent protein [Candidatus Omnitrophota bacterium]
MMDKIIIATVNCKKDLYAVTADEFSAVAPNIQLGLLHQYIKMKGVNVQMIESDVDRISMDHLIDIVEKENPVLFGIICTGANPSSSTMHMAGIVDFYEKFKQRGIKVNNFVWGPHPTVLPQRSLDETGADFIVRGEGYQAIVELYNALKNNSDFSQIEGLSYYQLQDDGNSKEYVHTKDAALVKDMDTLPLIDWDLMNPKKYRAHNWHAFGDINNRSPYAIIWTSFGCPFPCNFCCINNLFGKRVQRFRSVDSVIEEISILVEKHHVKHLKILDELFVVNS